jgi:hypothetical protein
LSKRNSAMKREMFEELLDSVCEAGAILRGEKKPSRRIVIDASAVLTEWRRSDCRRSQLVGFCDSEEDEPSANRLNAHYFLTRPGSLP